MKSNGFRIRNRTYYYISNDIAYCITFEQPTGLMYIWAHINPLYMPNNFLSLTYGNRLNHISDVRLPPLEKNANSAEIDQWCDDLLRYLDNVILPFFRQNDTPQKLVTYVEQPGRELVTRIICCPSIWLERLRMYTYMYLRDIPKVKCCIKSYRNEVYDCRFLTTVLQGEKIAETDNIYQIVSAGEDAIASFCEQTIQHSQTLFE